MSILEKYEAVIGLEVHAQLLTKAKMFCGCKNVFGALPNTHVCPVCTGQPGALPVVNEYAIELGVRAAIALGAVIHEKSIFARKNYFYPDLPKGYQISQYENPFATGGFVPIHLKSGEKKQFRLTRIHFEEDAGKSIHAPQGTLVDLNRAGVPLVEIVSEPNMRTSHEAGQYLRSLRNLLRYTDVCDGNLEEGSFRCDANISVRCKGENKFGTKVELKNINSFRYVEKAIDFEIERQALLIEQGQGVTQQTRLWNSAKGITEGMREKEGASDYRYFPDPDLPILIISKQWREEIARSLPELPHQKADRFEKQCGLPAYDAAVLTADKALSDFFELVAKLSKNPKASANWVINDLLGKLNEAALSITASPVKPEALSDLISRIDRDEISGKIAKSVFEQMFISRSNPDEILSKQGIRQISDSAVLTEVVKNVLATNPAQVAEYKAGKQKLLGYFVGQVMKQTKGQANPAMLNVLVKQLLEKGEA
jgi:aspartyl-tRNA(Asn)/glutamyl-tRNA(Gln) amidotransferase subunit B